MISEFVKALREKSALFSRSDFVFAVIAKDYKEAADTIEELSAKIASGNKERSEQYYKDFPDTNVGKNLSENLIERLEEERNKQIKPHGTTIINAGIMIGLDIAIEIVNQLTEEFGGDINVGSKDAELIEKIKFGIEASNINDDYTTGLRNGMRYCLALIDGKEPKFESCKQGWIPVSEALPDEEGSYLVTFNDGYVSSVPFYDEDWELWCDSGEPVAWQPLPEPYKGK